MRITKGDHHLAAVSRGRPLVLSIDGQTVTAYEGETIAAVLLVQGIRGFRHTSKTGEPRGMFCGMGVCYECRVVVDGVPNVRACMTQVAPGMVVETRSEVP